MNSSQQQFGKIQLHAFQQECNDQIGTPDTPAALIGDEMLRV
jgi:hypothetical protein